MDTGRLSDLFKCVFQILHPERAVFVVNFRHIEPGGFIQLLNTHVAQEVANRLIALGIRGFWNFTNIELSSSDPTVQFENIHFADSLLTLSYRIANR